MYGLSLRLSSGLVLLLLVGGPVLAADPPEQLPQPRPLPTETAPAPAYPVMPHPGGYYRHDRRAIWQYYQVDRFSQWRPLVVWGPYGAYYYYDGQPYPWATVNPRWVMPKTVGTPYRSE